MPTSCSRRAWNDCLVRSLCSIARVVSSLTRIIGRQLERLAQIARPLEPEAPGPVRGPGDPNAGADGDFDVLLARKDLERRPVQRKSIVRGGDAERFTEASRARAQQ